MMPSLFNTPAWMLPMSKVAENGLDEQSSIAEKRRQQIIAAAVTLFAERGYFQTTIEDISSAIGVGKGLIYRYFKDKNELLFCALAAVLNVYKQEKVGELLATLGPLAALRRVLAVNCAMAEEHTQGVTLAYHSSKDLDPERRRDIMAIESEIAGEIESCLCACIDAGLMRPFDARIMAYQYIMLGHTWALKNWTLRNFYTMRDFLAEGEQLLLIPHLTEAGLREFEKLSAETPVPAKPKRKAATK